MYDSIDQRGCPISSMSEGNNDDFNVKHGYLKGLDNILFRFERNASKVVSVHEFNARS